MSKKNLYHLPFLILLAILFGYAIHVAATLELQSWDEARNVLNAWEMQHYGDWIGITWRGQLDDWNLKPPFGTWLIALCIKLFGFSEFIVRIPSLLFGAGTLLLVYFFIFNKTQNYFLSATASLGLGSSIAFFGQHCWTTADYDVILVFFNTFSFIAVVEITFHKNEKFWIVLGVSAGLAFMTKSLPGLIPLSFLLLAGVIRKDFYFLKERHRIFQAITLFNLLVVPFFMLREILYEDDYVLQFFSIDLLNRITGVVEEHGGNWNFYITNMNYRFEEWYKLFYSAVLVVLIKYFLQKLSIKKDELQFVGYGILCAIIYFLIFSFCATKISWYTLPAYPLLLIVSVLVVHYFTAGWLQKGAYAILILMMGYQLNRLIPHTRTWTSRDYEKLAKYLILPNKEVLQGKKTVSIGPVMPSAITYLEIFSGGRSIHFESWAEGNDFLSSVQEFEMIITSDTANIRNGKLNVFLTSGSAGILISSSPSHAR